MTANLALCGPKCLPSSKTKVTFGSQCDRVLTTAEGRDAVQPRWRCSLAARSPSAGSDWCTEAGLAQDCSFAVGTQTVPAAVPEPGRWGRSVSLAMRVGSRRGCWPGMSCFGALTQGGRLGSRFGRWKGLRGSAGWKELGSPVQFSLKIRART